MNLARKQKDVVKSAQKRHYDASRRPTTFVEKDLVLRVAHTLSDGSKGITAQLASRRTGPFRLISRIGLNYYAPCEAATGRRSDVVHKDHLTPIYES